MTESITIVSTVSRFDERRGMINRLDMLIDYYRSSGYTVVIACVNMKRPNCDSYRDCKVLWKEVTAFDILQIIITLISLYPLSVAIYQRWSIPVDTDRVCFHLVRTIQLKLLRDKSIRCDLDFCENLSDNAFQRSIAGGSGWLKRVFLNLDGWLLKWFYYRISFNRYEKIFVISDFEKRRPVENSEVLSPDTSNISFRKRDINLVRKIFFLGHIDYEPNFNSLIELTQTLRLINSEIELHIVGKVSVENEKKLLNYDHVILYGYLENPYEVAKFCDLGYAYLSIGTGTQNKVFDYLRYNLPVIVSPGVYQGLPYDVQRLVNQVCDIYEFFRSTKFK